MLGDIEAPCVISDVEGRVCLVYMPDILLHKESVRISKFFFSSESEALKIK